MRLPIVPLLLLAVAPAWAADWTAVRILEDRDPKAAAAYLSDASGQNELAVRDPETAGRAFAAATDLVSVAELLRQDINEPRLRYGLLARPQCEFCQRPSELEAWALQQLPDLDRDHLTVLSGALLDWDILPREAHARLRSAGRTPSSWVGVSLSDRVAALEPWLAEHYTSLMNALPATDEEEAAYEKAALNHSYWLDKPRRAALLDRRDTVRTAYARLAELRRRLTSSSDASLAGFLRRAESAGTLEDRLSALASAFDGLGKHDPVLSAGAPAASGQAFDDSIRAAAAELLRSALFLKIAGTMTGDEVVAFYRDQPLDLRLCRGMSASTVASFSDRNGTMCLNEDLILRSLKNRGRAARDLLADPGLLDGLAETTAASFVHETTHQRQKAWRNARKLPTLYDQDDEIEAKELQALFVLEKSAQDPAFRRRLEADAASGGPAEDAVDEANELATKGLAAFRAEVRGTYSGIPSLEGGLHEWQADYIRQSAVIDAELARRAALPPEQAAALEAGPKKIRWDSTEKGWTTAIAELGTPALRDAAEVRRRILADPQIYQDYRGRMRAADDRVARRLAELRAGTPSVAARSKREVPLP